MQRPGARKTKFFYDGDKRVISTQNPGANSGTRNEGNWGSGNIFFHFHARMKESFTPIHIIFMERLASTIYPGGNVVAQSYTPLFSPTLWSH